MPPRARGAVRPTAAAARARSGAILPCPDIVAGSGCRRPPTSRGGMVPKAKMEPRGFSQDARASEAAALCASRLDEGRRRWQEPADAVLGLSEAARSLVRGAARPACGLGPYGSPRGGLCWCILGPHRAVRKAVLRILTLHRTAARFGSGPLANLFWRRGKGDVDAEPAAVH